MRRAVVVLSVLATMALCLSDASAAEELWVVKDGVLNKEALTPAATEVAKDHVGCGGETVDGLYVVTTTYKEVANWARFTTAKSALGDCDFRVVFSCAVGRQQWRNPNITITDRGRLCFWKPGNAILWSNRKFAMPLTGFSAGTDKNPFDGNLHSLAVKRVGDKISFYYDDKKINEQPIDPDANLHIWFDAGGNTCKIKSIKLTAEKLSHNLKSTFESAAPIQEIFKGSGVHPKPEYGKACRYRIPSLALSKKGTILAFAEARRVGGADFGNIDAVVKRSEDNGKTWGPEIVVLDDGVNSINNQNPVVDPKTGRIWVWMHRGDAKVPRIYLAYSDDDGKTWSKAKDMTEIVGRQIKSGHPPATPWPASGIVLERGKHAGRLIMSANQRIVYSDDSGETWKPGPNVSANPGESRCAELTDASLLFIGGGGAPVDRRAVIVADGGDGNATKQWEPKELVHVGCQGAVMRYSWPKDGKPGILLYSGPGSTTARAKGTLHASYDDGKTWPWKLEYYEGGSGYSDIAVLPDGRVAVLFEKDGKSKLGFTILPAPPAEAGTK
ncbi:MAG: sialidase family protein [Planctomycetota bacterium]